MRYKPKKINIERLRTFLRKINDTKKIKNGKSI